MKDILFGVLDDIFIIYIISTNGFGLHNLSANKTIKLKIYLSREQ